MAKVKVGVNGFGRIGRLATRFLLESEICEVVHVNELNADVTVSAYLLEFDSIHGKFGKSVEVVDGCIVVDSKQKISYSSCKTPGEVAWADAGVELVLECSGKFNDEAKLQAYFEKSVQRVLVSAPVNGAVNVVVGCNDELVEPSTRIVTAASCTTNCIGPVIKCIDETFGIERGMINTVHNVTNTQSIMDAPNTKKDDPRRARAGMLNLAPTSTGSAKAITMIFPHLKGKLNGVAIRVPLQNASITDLSLELKREVTVEEVNAALAEAADDHILGYEKRGLVSTDYINDTRSSIVDALSTMVVDRKLVKILAWYDNEMGYSARMRDIAEIMAKQMSTA